MNLIGFVLLSACFNLFIALVMKTQNLRSSVLFKFVPMLLGLGALIYFLNERGIV